MFPGQAQPTLPGGRIPKHDHYRFRSRSERGPEAGSIWLGNTEGRGIRCVFRWFAPEVVVQVLLDSLGLFLSLTAPSS